MFNNALFMSIVVSVLKKYSFIMFLDIWSVINILKLAGLETAEEVTSNLSYHEH